MWRNYLFAAGGVFFALSLWPVILDPKARVPRLTSVPTAAFLAAFAVSHWTLGWIWASITTSITALMWGWIAWRKAT